MKIRNGFVSNSSSSSFVVLKDALTKQQEDIILDYQLWVEFFIKQDEELKERFGYYDSDPWRIIEYEDFIFGETSMDNFSMHDFLDYIKVKSNYVEWDDGWNDEPTSCQYNALNMMKQKIRSEKLTKLNNL